ncbi:MAG: NADH-quinone oxidoreductase subunit A [Gammaproteobacteria bacterium]|nr:NADH-quinone oxidoreductase subunit A [Gammaproteobacteria bacterium]
MLALFLIVILSALIAVLIERRLGSSREPTHPQRIPFLGGGAPRTHAWQRYHVRYYPMTLLLLAFEMEMMFMYPWAVVYVEQGVKALSEMGMFLAILSIGILYGWREGVFRWQ